MTLPLVWIGVLASLAGAPALALTGLREPDPEAEVRRLAAEAFTDGEAAFKRGEYAAAIRAFARAQALAPHPHTLYNLGLAQTQDGRFVEAWHTFTALERTAETPEQRNDARAQLDVLRDGLAFVRALADPDETVCLDDTRVETGTTHVVLPGSYVLTAGSRSQRVELRAGETLQIDLRFSAPSERTRAMVPWLGTAAGAAAASFGLGIGAAIHEPGPTARGLAGAAAGTAAVALAGVVAAVIVHRRGGPVPRTSTSTPRTRSCAPDRDGA